MNHLVFYALPGFLGQPTDWDLLKLPIVEASIYKPSFLGMRGWAKAFNQSMQKQEGDKILIGYSLGGRLALHALIDNPTLWKGAILISSHLGLNCPTKKQERLAFDLQWAQRFSNLPWDALMHTWNDQSIFKGSFNPLRLEQDYTRKQLASILTDWSLAHQDNLKPSFEKIAIPILWIAGELDQHYADQASCLQLSHPQSKIWVAPRAGHRVHFHESDQLNYQIDQFIKGLI